MNVLKRNKLLAAAVLGLVLVAVLMAGLLVGHWPGGQGTGAQGGGSPGTGDSGQGPAEDGPETGSSAAPGAGAPPSAPAPGCPSATVTVTTANELANALANPAPGTVIQLADGVYSGNFKATGLGTQDRPITLCGTEKSILDGGQPDDGYVLHLERAAHWVLQGFTVRNGQKGVMLDEVTQSLLRGLTVTDTGDEAIHLRRFSTDNKVMGNTVRNTGLRKPKFGEGIYVGTAESNWCDISNCEPDRSDRNDIADNTISGTTAESIDIKEGTSHGTVRNNSFDGASMVDADSWVDVKGKGWVIAENTGSNSPLDGFQTHEIVDGWGTDNVFRGNTAEVNGPGFGYSLKPVRDNVVECNNKASQAGKGLSNEPCTG
jgi:hypothetical protein